MTDKRPILLPRVPPRHGGPSDVACVLGGLLVGVILGVTVLVLG